MSRDRVMQILFVEEDVTVWPRAKAFFDDQLGLVGARANLHLRRQLPERAAGFDLVSLDGRRLIPTLVQRADLLTDLRHTAIVNLHADAPGTGYGHLRRLLGRGDEGAHPDGLWVFPQSWMAPWFQEALEFPELGLRLSAPPRRRSTPSRTWERRSIGSIQILINLPEPAGLRC
jgi:hypothetical protein